MHVGRGRLWKFCGKTVQIAFGRVKSVVTKFVTCLQVIKSIIRIFNQHALIPRQWNPSSTLARMTRACQIPINHFYLFKEWVIFFLKIFDLFLSFILIFVHFSGKESI